MFSLRSLRQSLASIALLYSAAALSTDEVAQGSSLPPVVIMSDRIGSLHIGMKSSALRSFKIEFDRVEQDEQGHKIRVVGVRTANQVVRLEFANGRIWRLAVFEPGIRTSSGIEVGTPASTAATKSAVKVEIGVGGELVLLPRQPCGVAYWTNAALSANELRNPWSAAAVERLPASVTVTAIIVTGNCL